MWKGDAILSGRVTLYYVEGNAILSGRVTLY